VGELVWAKFSNYPYWPGYIKKILDNNTFEVYYFGDDEKSVEPKDKLKKWREYFDEAIKGNIEDDNYLFSLGVAMMVQERDQRVRNHKQFINNVTPVQKKEIIDEMKEFLLFSKNGNAKNILLRRGKKKPTLTTKDLLKDIKPMKDQIDKSFIDKMNMSEPSKQYVAAIISIGHIMGFEVISEGVELPEQLQTLREIGCDYIQGFIWGKPLPREEAEMLIVESVNE
jgi:hypothetical protein